MTRVTIALLIALSGCVLAPGQTTATATGSLTLTLSSAAEVSAPASLTLTKAGAAFQNYTGSELINYKARTTQAGWATVTLRASSAFSPAGGPSVANGDLAYTCSAPSLGSGCSGTQAVTTGSQTPVVAVPSSSCVGTGCASTSPATVTLNFVLSNNPQFPTGSYSAQILFTCSVL